MSTNGYCHTEIAISLRGTSRLTMSSAARMTLPRVQRLGLGQSVTRRKGSRGWNWYYRALAEREKAVELDTFPEAPEGHVRPRVYMSFKSGHEVDGRVEFELAVSSSSWVVGDARLPATMIPGHGVIVNSIVSCVIFAFLMLTCQPGSHFLVATLSSSSSSSSPSSSSSSSSGRHYAQDGGKLYETLQP